MILLLVVCACTVPALAADRALTWQQYKELHGKAYDEVEDEARRAIYRENMELVAKHNVETTAGLHSYLLGPNKFADMTNDEYRQLLKIRPVVSVTRSDQRNVTVDPVPESVDWRTSGFVGPVRDQGQCGDAEMFAALDSLQFQEINYFRSFFDLSSEQLLECCGVPCGCNGGGGYLDCVVNLGGIESAASYPTRQCTTCEYDPKKAALSVTGQLVSPGGDETALKALVASKGLAVAAVDASQLSFQLYAGGIYDEPECSSTMLDHSLAIVGYGSEGNDDFWIAKNSWGPNWGEEGYIRMSRNKNNQCGIASQAVFPVVARPNSSLSVDSHDRDM